MAVFDFKTISFMTCYSNVTYLMGFTPEHLMGFTPEHLMAKITAADSLLMDFVMSFLTDVLRDEFVFT